jgi:hypothetical protein
MADFSDILRAATSQIGEEYFCIAIAGGNPVYRERVYCYELYHQRGVSRRSPKLAAFAARNGPPDHFVRPWRTASSRVRPPRSGPPIKKAPQVGAFVIGGQKRDSNHAATRQRRARKNRGFDSWLAKNGGQRGIRTLERLSPLHTFQACAFNHSATCPLRQRNILPGRSPQAAWGGTVPVPCRPPAFTA